MGNEVNYNPDILSCLANLSNDEVFTPPELVNRILDMLPSELWSNPDTRVLDPCCKSGVFLREIAKRMLEGEKEAIPDLQQRIDHIFHTQLFGIAITELTSLLSRRSLYCSKFANGQYSVSHFEDASGNIQYSNSKHSWGKDGHCIFCDAPRKEYDRGEERESYAYEFIHLSPKHAKELSDMHFDLIIGNPPYQLTDGGAQASARPIYQYFIEQAKKLCPRYLVMIIPARWYTGGKGLEDFRQHMLADSHIKELHDFPQTEDCFPGVNIRGGVCYFVWDRAYDNTKNLTKVITHVKNQEKEVMRSMQYEDLDIFIRYGEALSIIGKVMAKREPVISTIVSSLRPFGFRGYFTEDAKYRQTPKGLFEPVVCVGKGHSIGYVEKTEIPTGQAWIDKWKVFIPRANNIGTELNDDNLNSFVGKPGEICTESFLALGCDLDLTKTEAENLAQYLQTKFARFMHSQAKSSQDSTSKTFRFVPLLDFQHLWTDEELYRKYDLNEDEIALIEMMIKPMGNGGKEA